MSHNPVPAEGYVSVLPFDTINGHQIQNLQASHSPLIQQFTSFGVQDTNQQQTLILVSAGTGDLTIPSEQKGSPIFVLTDLQTPQGIIQLPANAGMIQVPSIQVPSADGMTVLDVQQNAIQLDPSVSLLQMPNTLLLNNNVILCLQPEEAAAYQLTDLPLTISEAPDLQESLTTTALTAKSWFMDSDIANRALSALGRQNETNHIDQMDQQSFAVTYNT